MMSLFVSFTLTPMLCSRFLKLEPAETGHGASSAQVEIRLLLPAHRRRVRTGAPGGAAAQVPGRAPDLRGDRQHGPDRPDHGRLVDPPRRSERVRGDRDDARGLQPGADAASSWPSSRRGSGSCRGPSTSSRPIGQTEGGRVVKGEGDVTRATIYVRITDLEEREAATAVRGWWDLPGHVRRFWNGSRVRPVRRPAGGAAVPRGLPRPAGERQRRLAVPGRPAAPDVPGQPRRARPEQLSEYANQLIAELKKEPGLVDLDTTLSLRKPEVQVVVDREAASDLGVPVGTIADSLRVLVGGLPVSKFRDGDQQYDVWLRAESGDRGDQPGPLPDHVPVADGRAGQAGQPGQAGRGPRADRDRAPRPRADRHGRGQPRGDRRWATRSTAPSGSSRG